MVLNQYVTFTKVFDRQVKKYGLVDKAVRDAIRICMDRNVLKEYLAGREAAKEASIRTTIEEGRHFGASRESTAARLREKFSISKKAADLMMERYW